MLTTINDRKQNKLLSVIIPIYNTEKYLRRCIDSVLAQEYKYLEIILIDDGSTDGSGAICDDYAVRNPRVHAVHQENQGLSAARLRGVALAHGDFIAFVDSDDWQEKDALGKLIQPLLSPKSGGIDISVGGYVLEMESGEIKHVFQQADAQIFHREEALREMLGGKIFNWSMCQKIYRRNLFDIYDMENGRPRNYAEDTYFNWRLFRAANRVAYVPCNAYHYCQHGTNMMQQEFSSERLIYLKLRLEMLREAEEEKLSFETRKAICQCLLADGIYYLRWMAQDYRTWEGEIQSYGRLIDGAISSTGYDMSEREQRQWQLLRLPGAEEYEKVLAEKSRLLQEELRSFASCREPLYIYGAGIIAREVAAVMQQEKLPFRSFVITGSSKGNAVACTFEGEKMCTKKVVRFQELGQDELPKGAGFLLAMQERYACEATEMLLAKGIESGAILNAGRHSLKY